MYRHGAESKIGGVVKWLWAKVHHLRNSGSLSFLYHANTLHSAQNVPTSLPCHSLSLKNDESGIVMIAALCAMNGDTAFREKPSAI